MSAFKTKEFRSLHRDWMHKLDDEGFTDIEDRESPYEWLKRWDSAYFQVRNTPEEFKSKELYYQRASDLLNGSFAQTALEQNVWRLHCEGLSLRQISRELRTRKNKLNKDKAHLIVERFKRIMGVR